MGDNYCTVRYLPGWLPGQGWQKKATEWRALTDEMIEVPYALGRENAVRHHQVKDAAHTMLMLDPQMNPDNNESSIAADYAKSDPDMPADKEYSLKKALASMAGGTDTVRNGSARRVHT